jgi:transcriptional regulator GlxA family with amidase domain
MSARGKVAVGSMIDVTVLLVEGSYASTSIGPVEVFHSAGSLWNALQGRPQAPRFRVRTATLDGGRIKSPYEIGLTAQTSIASIRRTDLIVVPAASLEFDAQLARNQRLIPWLRRHARDGTYVAGVCTGAVFLAEAGLLDGRLATTHWAAAEELKRRYPSVKWCPDKFVTEDRRVLCSGGVFASVDLSLYLVEKFCGHDVAVQTARSLLVNMPRSHQTGYALLPLGRPHSDEAVHRAESFIAKHHAEGVCTEQLARQLAMSPRNFVRRFKSATGRSPGDYIQATRIAVARDMLETCASSVQSVGAAVGYVDPAYFRTLFKRLTGMTPAEYRECFASSRPTAQRRRRAPRAPRRQR